MKAKSTFLARNALPSPILVPGGPDDDGLGLLMAVFGRNMGPEKLVI